MNATEPTKSKPTTYRQEFRRAMKWWRAANPETSKHVTVRAHGWYGHVLWTTDAGGGVLMTSGELMTAYRAAIATGATP